MSMQITAWNLKLDERNQNILAVVANFATTAADGKMEAEYD